MKIFGSTKILGIIGQPVCHSLSPLMQNTALKACGIDAVYVPFTVSHDDLGAAVVGLRALGIIGFNVTIPYKTAIIPLLDELDTSAEVAGAVNTVTNINSRLIGYNTDGDGLVRSLAVDLDFVPCGSTVVIIGSGGAARGAIAALCRSGVKKIFVINRTYEKASSLVSSLSSLFSRTEFILLAGYQSLPDVLKESDALINTTSLGMKNDSIPYLSLAAMPKTGKIYDIVYSPPVTPLLKLATGEGLRCANGLGMLAAQGELAFTIWTGITPPSGLMKSTLEAICSV